MMQIGKRYVVTKASDDGTFEVGDHIWPEADGAIMCKEQCGWIAPERVPESIIGMEVEFDTAWRDRVLAKMTREIEAMK